MFFQYNVAHKIVIIIIKKANNMKFLYDAMSGISSYVFGGDGADKTSEATVESHKRIPLKEEIPQVERALALLQKVGRDFLVQNEELRQEYMRKSSAVNMALTDRARRILTPTQKTELRAKFARYKESFERNQAALAERKNDLEAKIYRKYAAIADFLPARVGVAVAASAPAPTTPETEVSRGAAAPRPRP